MENRNEEIHKLTQEDFAKKKKKYKIKGKKKKIWPAILLSFVAFMIVCYVVFVFIPIPFVRMWRDIYIETAMNTRHHQWLATYFIPGNIIDEVMSRQSWGEGGGEEFLTTSVPTEITTESETETETENTDILNLHLLKVGEPDFAGYTVSVIDEEEGLYIADVNSRDSTAGALYKGKILVVDDPSRVIMVHTKYKNEEGQVLRKLVEQNDCIAGINGSGFFDPNENGDGGDIVGYSMSQGVMWGQYVRDYPSILLTTDDKLVCGWWDAWNEYNIRDGMQFGPILIADGKIQVEGTAGWGLQPRTAIGQTAEGTIVMITIEGRRVGDSEGITVGELAKIMRKYGVINACCCDGGSSTMMVYNNEEMIRVAPPTDQYDLRGRRLPNAFVVKSKKAMANEEETDASDSDVSDAD